MKYKINIYKKLKIKNFINTQKFYFFIFFNIKKQKLNIKTQQILYNQSFIIKKFNNVYLKKVIQFSIFNNLSNICSSFIYLGKIQNKKELNLNFKKLNICSIILENKIYNSKQFKNILNINYKNTINFFYFFLLKSFFLFFYNTSHKISITSK